MKKAKIVGQVELKATPKRKYVQQPLKTKLAPLLGKAIAKSGRSVSKAGR